ncbi:SCP2 sterol-binding domain-containing protein [Rhodobacteraceae bacterium D3-12]|nr:SCP2 sterol-binding domain-containing protein [Rhodobacteraceae bacterium D3-12]
MKTLEEYTSGIASAISTDDFGSKTVRLDIAEVGSIYVSGASVSNATDRADCELKTDHATFEKMFHGQLDSTVAFGQGALQIDGDMGLALKVPPLFVRAATKS